VRWTVISQAEKPHSYLVSTLSGDIR